MPCTYLGLPSTELTSRCASCPSRSLILTGTCVDETRSSVNSYRRDNASVPENDRTTSSPSNGPPRTSNAWNPLDAMPPRRRRLSLLSAWLLAAAPLVFVLGAVRVERPVDGVEDEVDLFLRRRRVRSRRDRIRNPLLDLRHPRVVEADRIELLGRPVAGRVRPEELELRRQPLVVTQRLHQERRRLVGPLANDDRAVLPAPGRHRRAGLARRLDVLLERDALDRLV